MKIPLVGAELFHAEGWTDGQTDMTKIIVAFRDAANVPKRVGTHNAKETYRSEASNNSFVCEIASFRRGAILGYCAVYAAG